MVDGPLKSDAVALTRAPVPLSNASTSSRSSRTFLAGTDAEAREVAAADAAGRLFHTWQFLEQFLVQLLVPLSVLYLVLAHSCSAAANVMSVPRPFSCVFSIIFATAQAISMLPLLVLVAWVLRGPLALDESDAATAVLRMDVTATAAVLIMHRLAIAIKYAFQATAVYGRRMNAWVTYQERLDDQLFASWFKLTSATIEREVGAAEKTLDEDYASAAFHMEAEALATLGGMLHEEARAELAKVTSAAAVTAASAATSTAAATTTSTTTAIPASALASILLFQVNEMTSGHVLTLQRTTSLAGLLSTFSNTLLRAGLGLPIVGSSPLEGCIIIGAWVSNFLLLPTIFTFLAVGIVDHARRERALEALSSLLLPTPRGNPTNGSSSSGSGGSGGSGSGGGGGGTAGLMTTAVHPPLLPLRSLQDVRAFLAARATLLAFGAGFHSRLVTVISGDLIVLAAVAAYCAFTALTAPTAQGKGAVLAPLVLYHALVFPAIALCALGLLMAARANAAAAASATVVAQVRLHQRVLQASQPTLPAASTTGGGGGGGVDGVGVSPEFLVLLEDVERLLRDHSEPVTILGIAATPALTNTLLGGIVSLETLLISGVMTRLNAAATAAAAAGAGAGAGGGAVVSPSATASPTPSPMAESSGVNSGSLGAIVGYFFAAVTLVAVIAAAIVAVARRRRRSNSSSTASSSSGAAGGATRVVGDGSKYAAVSHNPMKVASEYGGTGGALGDGSTARTLSPPQAPSPAAVMPSSKPPPRQPKLPEGWLEHRDDTDVWYENTATGEVTWLHPGGVR
jgi:hypothetical protein